jgi:hypothetical protein
MIERPRFVDLLEKQKWEIFEVGLEDLYSNGLSRISHLAMLKGSAEERLVELVAERGVLSLTTAGSFTAGFNEINCDPGVTTKPLSVDVVALEAHLKREAGLLDENRNVSLWIGDDSLAVTKEKSSNVLVLPGVRSKYQNKFEMLRKNREGKLNYSGQAVRYWVLNEIDKFKKIDYVGINFEDGGLSFKGVDNREENTFVAYKKHLLQIVSGGFMRMNRENLKIEATDFKGLLRISSESKEMTGLSFLLMNSFDRFH